MNVSLKETTKRLLSDIVVLEDEKSLNKVKH